MQQDIRILKQKCNAQMIDLCPKTGLDLVTFGPRIPEKPLSVVPHPLKLHAKTC